MSLSIYLPLSSPTSALLNLPGTNQFINAVTLAVYLIITNGFFWELRRLFLVYYLLLVLYKILIFMFRVGIEAKVGAQ